MIGFFEWSSVEVLARGRGIGRLIAGVMEGDPVSIGILSVVGVGFVGYVVYQSMSSAE